jgi:tetratricopeptide (TPR) repeat protein
MKLLEGFVLRERTRATNDEAVILVVEAMSQRLGDRGEALLAVLKSLESTEAEMRLSSANVQVAGGNVSDLVNDYIESCGGDRYLKDTANYEVAVYDFLSGDPPEDTCVALVFAREGQEVAEAGEDVAKFLGRGDKWESLGRWGDALQCYQAALREHPEHPELLFRLGRAELRSGVLIPATKSLKQAYEACPERGDIARELGRAYLAVGSRPDLEVQGATHDDLKQKGMLLLERAAALLPDDADAASEAAKARLELGCEDSDLFFGEGQ